MTFLRHFATFLLIGALVALFISFIAMFYSIAVLSVPKSPEAEAEAVAYGTFLSMCSTLAGIAFFLTGVALHWWTAMKMRVYSLRIWIFLFCMALLFCINFPVGTVSGIPVIISLFTSRVLKK